MNKIIPNASGSFKYIYLVIFFALLAGVFHPFISGDSIIPVIVGILVLFLGLAGGVFVYKSATEEKRQMIYFGGGLGLIFVSLFLIFQITGRV